MNPKHISNFVNMNKVLFIGTGDKFRSKFSAIYFNARCEEKGLKMQAFSAGFTVDSMKDRIDESVLEYLAFMGIIVEEDDLRSNKLNEIYLNNCSKIICMDMEEHLTFLRQKYPLFVRHATYWHYPNDKMKSAWTTLPLIKKEIDHLIASYELIEIG